MRRLLFSILLITSIQVSAQSNWEQTNGPEGGRVFEITPSPDGNLYIGTMNGIYRSDDNGDEWQQLELNSNLFFWNAIVTSIVVNEDGDIFSNVGSAIIRSQDQGDTWEIIYQGDDNALLGPLVINNDGIIFSSEFVYDPNYSTPSYLIMSTDNGDTWEATDGFLQLGEVVQELIVNSNNHLFALTLRGIYRSENNGDSWTLLHQNMITHSIAVNSRNELFIGSDSAIYRSVNNGESLSRVFTGVNAWRIAIGNDDNVYANVSDGIYLSTDNGDTWNLISEELEKSTFDYTALAIDSLNNVFAGGDGLHRSSDNGTTWDQITDGIRAQEVRTIESREEGELFALTSTNEIFRSTDNGESWILVNKVLSDTTISFMKMTADNEIYFAHAGKLYRSSTNGETWNTILSEDESFVINDITVNEGDTLFIATNNGVMISPDNGETWMQKSVGTECTHLTSITITGTGTLVAGSFLCESLYRSVNNGDTWEEIPVDFYLLNIVINSEGQLFASDDMGSNLYRSDDDGRTWTYLNSPSLYNSNIVIDSNDIIYIPGNTGVYNSSDNGQTWLAINEGLPLFNITSVAVSPGGFVYSSPNGMGVWRRNLFVSTTDIEISEKLHVYPNPATKIVTVVSPSKDVGNQTIFIYNMKGKLIRKIPAKPYSTTIDVSNFPKGIYIINISGQQGANTIIVH